MRHRLLPLFAGAGLLALAACSPGTSPTADGTTSSPSASPSASPTAAPAVLTATPADGARTVHPDRPVTVSVRGGTIDSVTLRIAGQGKPHRIAGRRTGSTWRSTGQLVPKTHYLLTATAHNPLGRTVSLRERFRTVVPSDTVDLAVSPLQGAKVGVGQPIAVYFDHDVATARRAVENALKVTASSGQVGAWHWYGDRQVDYRPPQYWHANTKVTLHAPLANVRLAKGVWGQNTTRSFTVGARHVSVANLRTHEMKVYSGHHLVRTLPISGGRPEYPTKSGISVVLTRETSHRMDSRTVGITGPDAYNEIVHWATRFTWSGEFVHAAPWSVAEQGSSNVSHGCLNVSDANGEWFYYFSRIGDVVKVTGSDVTLQQGNGYADWNLSWKQWLAGSALHS